jgi:hypothetical protein
MLTTCPRRTGLFLGLTAAAAVAGCGKVATPTKNSDVHEMKPLAAQIDVIDLDGHSFDLRQGGDGERATVIVFTRTDCPISNRYAPTVKTLCDVFQPQGVRFFLVYVDPEEGPGEIRRHLAEFDYPCPALRDPEHSLVAATQATVTPEAIVFDKAHDIVYRGRIDDLYASYAQARDAATTRELSDAIEATLAGQPVTQPVTKAVGCPIADLK